MSHSLVNSGRVEFPNRLVIGMDPIAIAFSSETHPVSGRRERQQGGRRGIRVLAAGLAAVSLTTQP